MKDLRDLKEEEEVTWSYRGTQSMSVNASRTCACSGVYGSEYMGFLERIYDDSLSDRPSTPLARGPACRCIIIIIINFLFITRTCNAETWNGVIKSSSQIYCCPGRVALSIVYNC